MGHLNPRLSGTQGGIFESEECGSIFVPKPSLDPTIKFPKPSLNPGVDLGYTLYFYQ